MGEAIVFHPISTSLDRIQSFTLDLNWNESKRVQFGKRSQTDTDSGSVLVRIKQVQCKRKAICTHIGTDPFGSVPVQTGSQMCNS